MPQWGVGEGVQRSQTYHDTPTPDLPGPHNRVRTLNCGLVAKKEHWAEIQRVQSLFLFFKYVFISF